MFVLAAFVGFMVISRVPPLLHTPLMAATNAISGISLVGSLIAAGADRNHVATILGFIAVVCATSNIVGGFTDLPTGCCECSNRARLREARLREARSGKREAEMREHFIEASYLIASVLFILGLRSLTRPDKARRGMQQAAVGMLFAIAGTLLNHTIVDYRWIAGGLILGVVIGYPMGMWVPMTAMPQRIAISLTFSALPCGHARRRGRIPFGPRRWNSARALQDGGDRVRGHARRDHRGRYAGCRGKTAGVDHLKQPLTYKGQNVVNGLFFLGIVALMVYSVVDPSQQWAFYTMMGAGAGVRHSCS